MGFGLIIIGDEILSGRRRDRHLACAADLLARRGECLRWTRIIGDEPELIESTLRETMAGDDAVFSFGGIGATPDDMTRQCAAAAAGVPVERHPEAVALIEERFGEDAYPHRVRMAEFPAGSQIIPNPVNRVPGFSLGDHHFVPGFPQMAHPMIEWVLDSRYGLPEPRDYVELAVMVLDAHESQLIEVMERITRDFAAVKLFSLPILREDGRRIELGVKGPAAEARRALDAILDWLVEAGHRWEALAGRDG